MTSVGLKNSGSGDSGLETVGQGSCPRRLPGRGSELGVTETAVPTVLAVDVFDKFNFTGAWVPRLEDIRDDFPKELASSVFFSADFFKPPERRGEALGNWGTAGAPAARGRGALRGEEIPAVTAEPSCRYVVRALESGG